MSDDAHLLREFVERRSQSAFGELVQRHLGLVYHAALRQLSGDTHEAADVAQSVFLTLAAKAPQLVGHPSLAAWLHATTRFKVAEAMRANRRRRARETAATLMHELTGHDETPAEWERLRPLIDDTLHELNEPDREVVLLRFFEGLGYRDIGQRLGLNENSAHKRVERALDRLRERLHRRGVTSTGVALAAVLGGQAGLAVPSGLAASVTSAAMAAPAGLAGVLLTSKLAAAAALAVASATCTVATLQWREERQVTAQLAAVQEANGQRLQQLRHASPLSRPPAQVPAATAKAVAATNGVVARRLGTGGLASVEESREFLVANPDVREALRATLMAQSAEQFAELLAAWQLSPAERERFLELQAIGTRQIVGEHQLGLAATDEEWKQAGAQVRALLGEARYQQYREFRDGGLDRNLDREMARSLYYTAAPLTAGQSEELKRIVRRAASDPALPKKPSSAWPYLPLPVWDRILSDAAPMLAPPQVEALAELRDQSRFFHAQSAALTAYHNAEKEPPK